ncbi:MAG: hypothetical protein ACFFB5_14620 [Promethearchaeota archaeon]
MKELINQIRSVTTFCGFDIESIVSHKTFMVVDLKSKSLFRKKSYHLGVSKSLNGILAAERELTRNYKNNIFILDPINHLPAPTFNNVTLFHDLDSLQKVLNE